MTTDVKPERAVGTQTIAIGSITANQLRWLAEWADGERGQDFVLAWEGDELKLMKRKLGEPDIPQVINVRTDFESEGFQGKAQIEIKVDGVVYNVPSDADAVFLSESAVEKFVLPYYTRFRAPWWIQNLKRWLLGLNRGATRVVAVFHIPPSTSFRLPNFPIRPVVYDSAGKTLRHEEGVAQQPLDDPTPIDIA